MSEPTGGPWDAPQQQGAASGQQAGPQDDASSSAPPPPLTAPPGWGAIAPPTPGWGAVAPPDPRWGGSEPPATGWGSADAASGWGLPAQQAPRPGVVPLRPLGLGELLDGAVGIIRGYPRPALGVSAIVSLVTTVVNLLLLLTVLRPLLEVDTVALEAGDVDELVGLLAGAVTGFVATLLITLVASAVLTGFMTSLAGRAVLGQTQTFGELWGATRRVVPRLVGASVLVLFLVALPVLAAGALLVPLALLSRAGLAIGLLVLAVGVLAAPVLLVRLALTTSVVVLEDATVRTALRRSWRLVKGSSWRVAGILLLTTVVASFVTQVLQLPFTLLGGDGNPLSALSGDSSLSTRAIVLSTIGGGLAGTVVAPFTAGVSALLYIDRRMRAEGLDVALQAAAASRT